MSDVPEIEDEEYREAARRMYGNEGTLEVDEGAKVSRGDDEGAYVQAWVWVPDAEVRVKP